MNVRSPTPLRTSLLTLLAIFIFGGFFVGGLWIYSRRNIPAEYRAATPGVPAQQIQIVSCNLRWMPPPAQLIEDFNRLNLDFVLLQQVSLKDAQGLAEALNMRHNGELQLYYSPTNPDTRDVPGNAIMGRHAIFQGRVITNQGATDAGIWVEPVLGGRRFLLGCVDLSPPPLAAPAAKLRQQAIETLVDSWAVAPRPLIIGGIIPPGLHPEGVDAAPPADPRFFFAGEWNAAVMPASSGDVHYSLLILQPNAAR